MKARFIVMLAVGALASAQAIPALAGLIPGVNRACPAIGYSYVGDVELAFPVTVSPVPCPLKRNQTGSNPTDPNAEDHPSSCLCTCSLTEGANLAQIFNKVPTVAKCRTPATAEINGASRHRELIPCAIAILERHEMSGRTSRRAPSESVAGSRLSPVAVAHLGVAYIAARVVGAPLTQPCSGRDGILRARSALGAGPCLWSSVCWRFLIVVKVLTGQGEGFQNHGLLRRTPTAARTHPGHDIKHGGHQRFP